jgi:hypothetical protein
MKQSQIKLIGCVLKDVQIIKLGLVTHVDAVTVISFTLLQKRNCVKLKTYFKVRISRWSCGIAGNAKTITLTLKSAAANAVAIRNIKINRRKLK